MRYFITGATGFVGGRVARRLRSAGHDVVALVRDPAKAGALADAGIALARGDVTDVASLRAPMVGADGVFHIAGWYKLGVRDRSAGTAVNVEGTRNVLTVMRDLRIPKGVYTSTLAVNSDTQGRLVDETYRFEGEHLSEYDRTKAEAHDLAAVLARAGLPLVIVQPGVIYGPGDTGPIRDLFTQFFQRKIPMAPAETTFCWAYVDDIAAAHVAAMERGRAGESYFLAGPAHALTEVLALCQTLTGVRAPRLTAPVWLLRSMASMMDAIEQVIPVPATFSGEYLRESAGTTYIGTAEKARQELGFAPRALADGLPEMLREVAAALGKPFPVAR